MTVARTIVTVSCEEDELAMLSVLFRCAFRRAVAVIEWRYQSWNVGWERRYAGITRPFGRLCIYSGSSFLPSVEANVGFASEIPLSRCRR